MPPVEGAWLKEDWDALVTTFAIEKVVPRHLDDVRRLRLPLVAKVESVFLNPTDYSPIK